MCSVDGGGRGSEEQAEEEGLEDKVWGGSATPLAGRELILSGTLRHLELLMGPIGCFVGG